MKKIIAGIFLSTLFITGVAHAGPLSELQTNIDTINSKMVDMQSQIDQLKILNTTLQTKINNQTQTATIQPVQVAQDFTPQITATNARIDAVEKRVGVIEKAVSLISTNVTNLLNTTIDLLKQILKLK